MSKSERHRGSVRVLSERCGRQWDHTGSRQSNLYTVATPDGILLFDTWTQWSVGDVRLVSYEIEGDRMLRPRPVKAL